MLGVVIERKFTDPDDIALVRTSTGEKSRNTELLQPLVDVRQRLGGGHVIEMHGAQDLAPEYSEIVFVDALDPGAVGVGAKDHATLRDGLFLTRLVDQTRQPADELANTLVRHRRDDHAVPCSHRRRIGRIRLGADDHPGPFEKLRVVLPEFGEQDLQLFGG